jgi:hypothetical protein
MNKSNTPVWNIPLIEKKFKVLIKGELKSLNKDTINNWFKECLDYLLTSEDYERASTLRDAKIRFEAQTQIVRN